MAEVRVERRLAAIFAADVVGYSRLIGGDEEGTLSALKALRQSLLEPKITEHRGRIVKTTGDGVLVEFASTLDAVRCALGIQRAMPAHNADLPPDKRIEFRIGINVGDIIVEGTTSSVMASNLISSLEQGAAGDRCWTHVTHIRPSARSLLSKVKSATLLDQSILFQSFILDWSAGTGRYNVRTPDSSITKSG